jgi:hypothetical protein
MLRQALTTSVGHVIPLKKPLTSTDVLGQALTTSIGHVAGQRKKGSQLFMFFPHFVARKNFWRISYFL